MAKKKLTQARFLGRTATNSVPSQAMTTYIPVIAPTLIAEVPAVQDWVHEAKFDGYRMQVRLDGDQVTITSRTKVNWTDRFPFIVHAFNALPAERLIIDGKIVSLNAEGISDFGALQNDLSTGRHQRIIYFAFDLMFFDGFDLTATPLWERKEILKAFLEEAGSDRILYSEHFENGPALFLQAEKLGLEGVVSKLANSPYKPSRSNWVKVKCQHFAEFHIIGFVPSGRDHIAALRLGKPKGEKFDYVGKVGTGFTTEFSASLRKILENKITISPSLSAKVRKPDTRWVIPDLRARIAYRGMTGDGKLRHPSFKGLLNGEES